jgi:hypothetical protein
MAMTISITPTAVGDQPVAPTKGERTRGKDHLLRDNPLMDALGKMVSEVRIYLP